ncbi:MAG: branched-chain amino acid ABC transporter permease [Rhizobiales bacterium 24-66-13]|jgi:branched-chain amino acid transport system permease protein|nr:MAG: branched-chain amino acid ABC transporter permease [Rhizobiales bacterium 24-66-13]OZB11679.1 MAG: branched-chain amino acid ABC transporter permease [Rhizobiales bacterium 39-66-18]HQS10988.1 branched-chain amino acid ABC transporter permease [Xanthobacteraceae bacterium]HQS44863.1 branched-chain amino acid ABC transporter permease [Xanthobacteraceae bacterium]
MGAKATLARVLRARFTPLIVLAALMVLVPMLAPSSFHLRVAALVWIFALAALGLTVLMGYAGQVSLGHAGFVGIGAYAVAIGPARLGLDPLLCLLLGAVLAGVIAYGVGRPILKLKGYYLAIATLGFGVIVALVLHSEAEITGGPDGMAVSRLSLFGWRVSGALNWYWVTSGALLIGALLALNIAASPTGRALRALHDSEVAAAGTGIDVGAKKLAAFVAAAVYGAVAGGLLAAMNGLITPEAASFSHSIELVAMVIIGGLGSVFGTVVGAAFLVVLPQMLTALQEYEQAVLGLLIMVFMIFLPQGIVPSIRAYILERLP